MSLRANGLRFYGGPGFAASDGFSRRAAPRFIQPSSAALYNCNQHFCDVASAPIETVVTWTYPHNPQEQGSSAKGLSHSSIGGFSMISRSSEAAIDEIVASCDGDIHGALKALLLVNEQLEAELQQLYAAVALGRPFERGSNALH
jgi:hypothetical protein